MGFFEIQKIICSDPRLQRGFSEILHALIKTKSCLLSEWARAAICFDAFIKKVCRFFANKNCSHNKTHTWALLTDLDNLQEVIGLYTQRMKIEETFKDWKSTGFDIEKLQIRQWDEILILNPFTQTEALMNIVSKGQIPW